MKYMASFLSSLMMATCLMACDSDSDETYTNGGTTIETISVAAEGATQQVSMHIDQEWRAFPSNDEPWIKITPATGNAGDVTLSLDIEANKAYTPRKGQITVKAGQIRKYIDIEQEATTRPAIECPLNGYHLVWSDEFDYEGTIDQQKGWTYQVANAGWVNHELQTYVNIASPSGKPVASVQDGALSINCFREGDKIYSGRVYAKASTGWQYGYIEASIKLPKGKGTWPAFWMMPVHFTSWPADGEIDIMEEVGYHPNYTSSSLHATAHVHSNNTQVTAERLCPGAESEYHTYGIEWTADYITTYVDGEQLLHYKNRGLGKADWPYDAPFYVILNLAWGGDWGGQQGVDENALPVSMQVDWVRVWQK